MINRTKEWRKAILKRIGWRKRLFLPAFMALAVFVLMLLALLSALGFRQSLGFALLACALMFYFVFLAHQDSLVNDY